MKMDLFLQNILVLRWNFSTITLKLIPAALLVLYYLNSNYFECSLMNSRLSLSYFHTEYVWVNWGFVLFIIVLFMVQTQMTQHQNEAVHYQHSNCVL